MEWESRTALRRPTFPPPPPRPPPPPPLLPLLPLLLFLLSSEPLCVTPTLLFCCLMPATPPSRGGRGTGRGVRPRARCFDLNPPPSVAYFSNAFILVCVFSFLSSGTSRAERLPLPSSYFHPSSPFPLPSFPPILPRGSALVQRPGLTQHTDISQNSAAHPASRRKKENVETIVIYLILNVAVALGLRSNLFF